MKVRGSDTSVQCNKCDCVYVSSCPCVLYDPDVCLQKKRRRVMKTLMKTMTGMMMMMIMTAAQRTEELLWTAVFALQVGVVGEKI